jgi:hypothetical protein
MKKLAFVFLSLLAFASASFAQTDSLPDWIKLVNGKTYVYDLQKTVPDSAGNIKPVAVFNKLSIPADEKLEPSYFKILFDNPMITTSLKTKNVTLNARWSGPIPKCQKRKLLLGQNDADSSCVLEWINDPSIEKSIPLFLVVAFLIISGGFFGISKRYKGWTDIIFKELSAFLMIAAGTILIVIGKNTAVSGISSFIVIISACLAIAPLFISLEMNRKKIEEALIVTTISALFSFIITGIIITVLIKPFYVGLIIAAGCFALLFACKGKAKLF